MTSYCHLADQCHGGFERSDVVDLHDPCFVAWLFADASIVDEDVDTTKCTDRPSRKVAASSRRREVDFDCHRAVKLGRDAFQFRCRPSSQGHLSSFSRQCSR
jgi:hypothetical protein